MTFDIELARHNMIDNQVRAWSVLDMRVLDMLGVVRREEFVPAACRNQAFADMAIPLGHGEVMMKPVVEGRLLQALALEADESVLEIGTGSGYLAACMASMAGHVTSVDLHPDFTAAARNNLARSGIDNITLATGDAVRDYQPNDRFDAVVVTGAVPEIPERFLDWLKPGGRAFLIHGTSPVMHAVLCHREDDGRVRRQSLFETDLPYLVHAAPVPTFSF